MTGWAELERELVAQLALGRRPVAVAFLDEEPKGVERFSGNQPSGCSFWRLAAQGRVFYTVAEDHTNCAVGAHTHRLPLSAGSEPGLEATLEMMFEASYLRAEDVAQVQQLPRTPQAILYAPLGRAPREPDVVLVVCRPAKAMLLNEAALRAGAGTAQPPLARPTCMALPAALARGAVVSLGCIGNRVYTGVGDDEIYVVIPGRQLPPVAAQLGTIVAANAQMEVYARGRRNQLAAE